MLEPTRIEAKEPEVEGVINPLAVRDPWRCGSCGFEWLVYDSDEAPAERHCPRCDGSDVAPIRG